MRAKTDTKSLEIDAARLDDPLVVRSVEKAFRVLATFNEERPSMNLTQLAVAVGLDKSATQRFTHTLVKLGYLSKHPSTKQFELTAKMLDFGYHYTRANRILEKSLPYLLHLSKTTEETINLTILDGTEIVFVSRFMSRYVLNNDVIIGTRMPAYCTAPGIAILSRLDRQDAGSILGRSNLTSYTPATTCRLEDLLKKLDQTAKRGYATAFEEYYHGDLSVAAAVVDATGAPIAAINIGVSRARFSPDEAEERFSPLVVAAAMSVSQVANPRR